MVSSTACDSLCMSDTVSKHRPFSFIFNWGKKQIHGGKVRRVGRMGNDNHAVVSHKLCGFQGRVGGRVVVMKEPVVVAPKFRGFRRTISLKGPKTSQYKSELTVVLGGTNSRRTMPYASKKTMNVLFVELRTCRAFFPLGDCGLFHCYDCCFVSRS
jgi:hypothetical protein